MKKRSPLGLSRKNWPSHVQSKHRHYLVAGEGIHDNPPLRAVYFISNRGIPSAKLVPFRTSLARRSSLGQDRGKFIVPDDFNDPLSEDILVAFEGGGE